MSDNLGAIESLLSRLEDEGIANNQGNIQFAIALTLLEIAKCLKAIDFDLGVISQK